MAQRVNPVPVAGAVSTASIDGIGIPRRLQTPLVTRCMIALSVVVLALSAATVEASHKVAHCEPLPADNDFASDFSFIKDQEWGIRLGGWGGIRKGHPLRRPPVIFVHGNTRDAWDWDEEGRSVKQRFLEDGYTMQELWAISYNGKSTKLNPPPLQCRTDNSSNVSDLTAVVNAVLAYTGAAKVDIVAHSLGVTLVRSAMRANPELSQAVRKFVGIAGPNHGTTVCRRAWLVWLIGWKDFIGCDELVPGSDWLARLNEGGGTGETPGPARYMTIYDGTGADVFYRSWLFGWPVGDADSPALKGAENKRLPGLTHDELRTDPQAVALYLRFVSGP